MDINLIENQQRLVKVSHISKSPRSRQYNSKLKFLRSKEMFLTDTQTSDYTKSSYENCAKKIIQLQEVIVKLKKQNKQLQSEIIQLRKKEFLVLNEQRLKQFLIQMQNIKNQALHYQRLLEKIQIENKVLQTMNKNLKIKMRQMKSKTKSINTLSSKQQDIVKQRKYATEKVDTLIKKKRHESSQLLTFRGEKSQPKAYFKQQINNATKPAFGTSHKIKDEYYTSKNRKFHHKQK